MSDFDGELDAFEAADREEQLRSRGWYKDRRTGLVTIGRRWQPGELMNGMGFDEDWPLTPHPDR